MSPTLPSPHPHHPTHLAIVIGLAAAVLTAAFHVLFFERPFGFPFAISIALIVVAVHAIAATAERKPNLWAYLFLIPAGLGLVSEILYASWTVRTIGFVIVTVSISFFAYWVAAARVRFSELNSLWPLRFFKETFFPFDAIRHVFSPAGKDVGARGRKIIFGLTLALPFLIIIGSLFASADPLFRRATVDAFFSWEKFPEYLGKFIRDFIAFFFFLGSASALVIRAARDHHRPDTAPSRAPERMILSTFLISLNLLFALFLAFQIAYFFGGEDIVKNTNITYAEYARQGFFQLLWVAGIVFLVCAGLYRFGGFSQWLTRELALVLIAQTGVVIASAISRLRLYTDAFGLTVSRWWALAVIIIIALVLASVVVAALLRVSYARWVKFTFVGTLCAISALLLLNVEGHVVRVNIDRFLSGKTTQLDLFYLTENYLSSDTVPELVRLYSSEWPSEPSNFPSAINAREYLSNNLYDKLQILKKGTLTNWRHAVISDYRAAAALAPLDLKP